MARRKGTARLYVPSRLLEGISLSKSAGAVAQNTSHFLPFRRRFTRIGKPNSYNGSQVYSMRIMSHTYNFKRGIRFHWNKLGIHMYDTQSNQSMRTRITITILRTCTRTAKTKRGNSEFSFWRRNPCSQILGSQARACIVCSTLRSSFLLKSSEGSRRE